MKRFTYGFGYETPQQRSLNELHGWDDEDSAEIIVRADTAEAARSWGREVAAASVRYLFEQAGVPETPTWREAAYAEWVSEASAHDTGPEVAVGEFPDLAWLVHTPPAGR